jgi:molybdopterin converting factor small subunit
VKIKLTSNCALRIQGSGDFSVPESVKTIGELLRHLGRRIDFVFVDKDGEMLRPDVEILLNGKEILFFPRGLKTRIEEGDSVDITLTPLGGG